MHAPAKKPTEMELSRFAESAPASIPRSYLQFLADHGAAEFRVPGLGFVMFWPLGEVLRLNAGYGFTEFAPELFGFGSDGGGELYAFDLRRAERLCVGRVPAVPLDIGEYQQVAADFDEFASLIARESGQPG